MASPDDLPTQSDVEAKLFYLLVSTPKGVTAQEAYALLADVFGLTYPQARRKMDNQWREPHWHNRVRQAHRALVTSGFAKRDGSKIWMATEGYRDFSFDLEDL